MNMDLASERLNGGGPSTRRKAPSRRESFKRIGVPVLAAVLSLACLVSIGFLVKVYLEYHYFFCKQPLKLVPLQQVCDGNVDCLQGEDEANCPQWVREGPPAGARVSKDRSILQVLNRNTGAWFCVCHDHFNLVLAKAACEEMGYRSTPTFREVEVGAGQPLPPREVVLSNGSLQVPEPGRNNPIIQSWSVKAGSDLLSGTTTLAVEKVFLAEATSTSAKINDIALVKLRSPVHVTDRSKPICLPYFDEELLPGTSLWVTGWGYTQEHGKLSEILQQAEVKLIDRESCNLSAYHGEVTEKMLCAGLPQGGVDTCQGDSGGPLLYSGGHWQVVGIVSWGQGCGDPSTPGVYTSVRAYLNWIYAVRRLEL
ncbi:transmembrane protease serine 4 [Patagioenas fasciata monilis]|uniref:Transmembrane protease serine 4 n=1 Tax=Patagioenas fasciata monilis TaxID=372326 RepID=A0A1V4J924_PATFA|nr:transmembrane protease serine 4 [Patagioenas fasciata monilis]